MIPIQPIGPGSPSIEPPKRTRRVRRAPKRTRDEAESGKHRAHEDQVGEDENELDGDDEAPHIDLRA